MTLFKILPNRMMVIKLYTIAGLFFILLLMAVTPLMASPLIEALAKGDNAEVTRLIASGANLTEIDERGRSALHSAVGYDRLDSLNQLIKTKIDIDTPDGLGNSALLFASINNKLEAATILIKAGANVNFKKQNSYVTPLLVAIYRKYPTFLKLLLDNNAIVTETDSLGKTVLMFAAEVDSVESVPLLLAAKVAVNAKTKDGRTALFFAAEQGNDEIVKMLLKAGIDASVKGTDGEVKGITAAELARAKNHAETAKLIETTKP
ncbi:MAG: ankyrin repeat domain-containing protein [Candidatus Pacebacteria bacterium]|nr:ankyrin repeat domain-containing protein [Candidatus Paceibacterota bacterium]